MFLNWKHGSLSQVHHSGEFPISGTGTKLTHLPSFWVPFNVWHSVCSTSSRPTLECLPSSGLAMFHTRVGGVFFAVINRACVNPLAGPRCRRVTRAADMAFRFEDMLGLGHPHSSARNTFLFRAWHLFAARHLLSNAAFRPDREECCWRADLEDRLLFLPMMSRCSRSTFLLRGAGLERPGRRVYSCCSRIHLASLFGLFLR